MFAEMIQVPPLLTLRSSQLRSFLLSALLFASLAAAAVGASQDSCPKVRMEVRRLPDLNVPRYGHATFCVNGEVTVAGGHTSGFVPTQTAEYYADGKWHLMSTVYTHDDGLCLPLSSGKVLLAGGHHEPLGIGQTFRAEWYHPDTHSFEGFGCLEQKRSMARGAEIEGGKVVIAGNWYAADILEIFDGIDAFRALGPMPDSLASPFMVPVAGGEVLIFGPCDNYGRPRHCTHASRLNAPPLYIPLFEKWQPFPYLEGKSMADSRIDLGEKDEFAYLLPVHDGKGKVAVALLRDTLFSLLPTAEPVPMRLEGDTIFYDQVVISDRKAKLAYLPAICKDRFLVLRIDYTQSPAPLTLYCSDPMPRPCFYFRPVLTPDGNLMIAGGYSRLDDVSAANNFKPSANVFLLCVGETESTAAPALWRCIIVSLGAVALIAALVWRLARRRSRRMAPTQDLVPVSDDNAPASPYANLFPRICHLMEEQQLFLQPDLKVSDVAAALSTNSRYVSECIKAEYNCSFIQFVNTYRINHAKNLLRQQPDIKIVALSTASGFSVESTFFRAFRAVTGMTPKEWIAQNHC